MELSIEQQRALAVARARQRMQQQAMPKEDMAPAFSGSILPLSRSPSGEIYFDMNAGIPGAIKRAVTLPGEVMRGEVDPSSQEGIERAAEMALTFSPVPAAVRGGEYLVAPGAKSASVRNAKVPTSEELLAAGAKQFDAARELGVEYDGNAVAEAARNVMQGLQDDGFLAETAPKTFGILDKLTGAPENSIVKYQHLEAARRAFGKAGKDFNNPTDQEAARRVRDAFDRFVENPPDAAVSAPRPDPLLGGGQDAMGSASAPGEVARLNREARANYAAGKRSSSVTDVLDRANLRAAAANSGANVDNSIRSRVASLLENPRLRAGFNPEEIAQLEMLVRGGPVINTARTAGNLLGGGGGLGAALTTAMGAAGGAAAGGPLAAAAGASLPLVGAGLKAAENSMARKGVNTVAEAVRKRSPLYEERLAATPSERPINERNLAIVRSLLSQLVLGGGAMPNDPLGDQPGPTKARAAIVSALLGS